MYGCLKDSKITAKQYSKYLDNKDIFISIDGIEEGLNLPNLKELYTTMGEDFVYKIHGFCSICLHDKNKDILMVIRDKMGTKPVYYCENNNSFLFGNDIMEIIKEGDIEKEINLQSLSMYFRYEYISPPETIFKNIYKLGHGQYLKLEKGKIAVKTYWNVIDKFNTNSKETINDFETAKNIIRDNLNSFVRNIVKKEKNIEMTFKIPHKFKYHNKIKKYILKQVLYDYVPEKYYDNNKRGFGIPKKKWIKEYLVEDLKRFSSKDFIKKQNIFNYEKVCNLVKGIDRYKYTNVLWNYCIFQIWYEKYMT